MNRLEPQPHDVRQDQIYREKLLAKPTDFFRAYCGGQVPDLMQKIHLVEQIIQASAAPQVFTNDVYRVQVRQEPPFVHLTISRRDGQQCKSWSDFQRIKNELVGPECEALELFPAESRLVDTSNEYHLWVIPQPTFRFPLGYTMRLVLDKPVTYGRRAEDVASRISGALPLDGAVQR
jgi:hypothetical protein